MWLLVLDFILGKWSFQARSESGGSIGTLTAAQSPVILFWTHLTTNKETFVQLLMFLLLVRVFIFFLRLLQEG